MKPPESSSTEQYERRYAVVTGRTFSYSLSGAGYPTVVFESGAGESLETWKPIYDRIASSTQVFRYDRAGLGQSDASIIPRTIQDAVDDLHALIQTVRISEPYILVGHSLGGLISRLYAHQYKDEVAGIVLIDSPHPDQLSRFETAIPSHIVQSDPIIQEVLEGILETDPARHPEGIDFAASLAQAEQADDLGTLPLVVLAHRKDDEGLTLRSVQPDLSIDAALAFEGVWHSLQADLTTLSRQSQLIVASQSGHYIHWDEPELVITTIRSLIARSRAS